MHVLTPAGPRECSPSLAGRLAGSGHDRDNGVLELADVMRTAGSTRRLSADPGELFRKSWYEFHAPLFTAPGEELQPDYFAHHIHLVPVHLVVLIADAAITTTIQALDTSRVVGGAGIYPFVQNIILGVRNEGLGTTLTTVLVPVEVQARQLLGIPDGYHIAAHLAVGWPEGTPHACHVARSRRSPPATTLTATRSPCQAPADTRRAGRPVPRQARGVLHHDQLAQPPGRPDCRPAAARPRGRPGLGPDLLAWLVAAGQCEQVLEVVGRCERGYPCQHGQGEHDREEREVTWRGRGEEGRDPPRDGPGSVTVPDR